MRIGVFMRSKGFYLILIILTLVFASICLGSVERVALAEPVSEGGFIFTADDDYQYLEKSGGRISYNLQYDTNYTAFPAISVSSGTDDVFALYCPQEDKFIEDIDISMTAKRVEKQYVFSVFDMQNESEVETLSVVINIIPISINNDSTDKLYINGTAVNGNLTVELEYGVELEVEVRVGQNGMLLPKHLYDVLFYGKKDATMTTPIEQPTDISVNQMDRYYARVYAKQGDGRISITADDDAGQCNYFRVLLNKNSSVLVVQSVYEIDYSYQSEQIKLVDILGVETDFDYIVINNTNNKEYVTLADIINDNQEGGFVSSIGAFAGQTVNLILQYKDDNKFDTPQSTSFDVKIKRLTFDMTAEPCSYEYSGESVSNGFLASYVTTSLQGVEGIEYEFFRDAEGLISLDVDDVIAVGEYFFRAKVADDPTSFYEAKTSNIAKLTIERATVIISINGQNATDYSYTHSSFETYVPAATFNIAGIALIDCDVVYIDANGDEQTTAPNSNGSYTVKVSIKEDNVTYFGEYEYTLVLKMLEAVDYLSFDGSKYTYDEQSNTYSTTYNNQNKRLAAILSAGAPQEFKVMTVVVEYMLITVEGATPTTNEPKNPGEYIVRAYLSQRPSIFISANLVISKAEITIRIKNQNVTYGSQLTNTNDMTKYVDVVKGFVGADGLSTIKDYLPNVYIRDTDGLILTKEMTEDSYDLVCDLTAITHPYYAFVLEENNDAKLTILPKQISVSFETQVVALSQLDTIVSMDIIKVLGLWQNVTLQELFPEGITLGYVPIGLPRTEENTITEIDVAGTYSFVITQQTVLTMTGKYVISYDDSETEGVLFVRLPRIRGNATTIIGDFHPLTKITVTSPQRADIAKSTSKQATEGLTAIDAFNITYLDKGTYGDTFTLCFTLTNSVEYDSSTVEVISYKGGIEQKLEGTIENGELKLTINLRDGEGLRGALADRYIVFAKVAVDYTLYYIIGGALLFVVAVVIVLIVVKVKKRKKEVKEVKQNVTPEQSQQEVASATSSVERKKHEEFDDLEEFDVNKQQVPNQPEEDDKYKGMTAEEKALEIKKEKRLAQIQAEQEEAQKAALSAIAKEEEERAKKEEQEKLRLAKEEEIKEKRRLWEEKWASMTPEEKQAYKARVQAKKEAQEKAKREQEEKIERERQARIAEKEAMDQAAFESYSRKTDEEIAREKAKAELDRATEQLARKKQAKTVDIVDDDLDFEKVDMNDDKIVKTSDADTFTVSNTTEEEQQEDNNQPQAIDLETNEDSENDDKSLPKKTKLERSSKKDKADEEYVINQNKDLASATANRSAVGSDVELSDLDMSYDTVIKHGMFPKAKTIGVEEAKNLFPARKIEILPDGKAVTAPYFESELLCLNNESKYMYSEMKNTLLRLGLESEYVRRFENYSYEGKVILKLAFVEHTLALMLKAEDSDLVENLQYENLNKDKKYSEFPICFKICYAMDLDSFMELISKLQEQLGLTKDNDYVTVNFVEKYPFVENLNIDDKRRM